MHSRLVALSTTRFYWGDDLTYEEIYRYANVADQAARKGTATSAAPCNDRHRHTAPVDRFPANRFGLRGMSGNVLEWTEDCRRENYSPAPSDARPPTTGSECENRVLRGGSWGSPPAYARSAARFWNPPHIPGLGFGFRVARAL